MTGIAVGSRVTVSRSRFSQGGTCFALGKSGTVKKLSGRYCVIVLDGELDELGFFADELDMLESL
jgi:hypothetical protein